MSSATSSDDVQHRRTRLGRCRFARFAIAGANLGVLWDLPRRSSRVAWRCWSSSNPTASAGRTRAISGVRSASGARAQLVPRSASRVARMEHMAFDEKVAAQLDAFYRTRDVIRRRELALAALDAQPADAVVDIGCGPGFYVAALAEQAARVTGIDPSASMLAMAARKTEGHRNVTLLPGEATALPL